MENPSRDGDINPTPTPRVFGSGMNPIENFRQKRIEDLAYPTNPGQITDMIDLPKLPKPMRIWRDGDFLLGRLDTLSNELLLRVLGSLDFQALSRFAQVSVKGKMFVESMPQYRRLMEHASDALLALSRTKLITEFSADLLYKTLRAEACCSCGEYGRFLYLPTCSRCCWFCLVSNTALWVIPMHLATEYFDLSITQLETLPVMYTIPNPGKTDADTPRKNIRLWVKSTPSLIQSVVFSPLPLESAWSWDEIRLKVVSVGAALRLSRLIHGEGYRYDGYEPGSHFEIQGEEEQIFDEKLDYFYRLGCAWLEPYDEDPMRSFRQSPEQDDEDPFSGTATIPFLSLASLYKPEHGLFCVGCLNMHKRKLWKDLPEERRFKKHVTGVDEEDYYNNLQWRVWSKGGFLEHVKTCYGAQTLLSATDKEWGNFDEEPPWSWY